MKLKIRKKGGERIQRIQCARTNLLTTDGLLGLKEAEPLFMKVVACEELSIDRRTWH